MEKRINPSSGNRSLFLEEAWETQVEQKHNHHLFC